LRILYINSLYAPEVAGGAERVVQAQAEAMQAAGHSIGVLALTREPGLHLNTVNEIPVWKAGLRNIYFHYDELSRTTASPLQRKIWHAIDAYNPLMKPFVRKVIEDFRPDVASVHNLNGWSIAAWDALKASRVPIVQVLHDQYLLCPTATMFRDNRRCVTRCTSCQTLRALHRFKIRNVDTVVGVSRFICDKLRSYGYLNHQRSVTTIPNIRDVSHERIPLPGCNETGKTFFGYIGAITPPKGVEFLLEAMAKTRDEDWKLLIAGGGEAQYVEALQKKFSDHRIEFLGRVNARAFFERIDVTIIPSIWEDTFPSVAFESILYGRPVLGSLIGGIPELVNDENGRLFTPGDSADLLSSIRWAVSNREGLRASAQAISINASRFGDRARWIEDWSRVYGDAIQYAG
jgi:glycosyltransferase involved in cell wall biosynthesis